MPLFTDNWIAPRIEDRSREYATDLAVGLVNGKHTLELATKDKTNPAARAIRVYRPPGLVIETSKMPERGPWQPVSGALSSDRAANSVKATYQGNDVHLPGLGYNHPLTSSAPLRVSRK